jgi:hypothetical protein
MSIVREAINAGICSTDPCSLDRALENCPLCGNTLGVVLRFKSFVQILLAVLALGTIDSSVACASGTSEKGKVCCCTHSASCKCHSGTPCKKSCTLAHAQAPFDKQLSSKTALVTSPHGFIFLFAVTLAKVSYPVFVPVIHQRERDASPPFGGHPAQAVLRLWLI